MSPVRLPLWLQGVFAPTLMIWVYTLSLGVACSFQDGRLSWRANNLSAAALGLILSWWVLADAQKRKRTVCYDYGSFVFFAWVVLVPVYLFQTRGIRAFVTLLCFCGLWLFASLVGLLIAAIRGILPL